MNLRVISAISIFTLLLWLPACSGEEHAEPDTMNTTEEVELNTLSEVERADGWISLFDGQNLEAWRGWKADEMLAGWTIQEDAMVMTDPTQGGDLVTRDTYGSFEFKIDWRVPEGGNSGIMFHVTEDHGAPWATGPEVQILDNAAFEGGAMSKNSAGSNYDVHPPMVDASKPAGEWNSVHLIVDGPHVEHWLNGQKVVEYELWTDEWRELVNGSKWIDHPDYGMREVGHIALQGDHGPVAFRNMKVKSL